MPSTLIESKKRLRVVFGHNGLEAYDRLFLQSLASSFDIHLATFVTPTQVPKDLVVKLPDFGRPLRIRGLNKFRVAIGAFWRIFQFGRHLKSFSPDVVIGNCVTTYGLYTAVCRWKPFVLFVYGSDVLVDPYRSPLHYAVTVWILRNADLILVDSAVQKEAVLALGGDPKRVICFPWVNLNDTRSVTRDSSFRSKLHWEDKIVVVSVRKHEPLYAIDTLIRAIPEVLARHHNVRFLIFGEGTQTTQLVNLADRLGVKEWLHFAGDVSRRALLGYMRDCDIYVSTSLSDGCSSSLLEAMSLGVPVIVTSIPGNLEWVSNSVNGITFEKMDAHGLAQAILRLVLDPADAEIFGRRASDDLRNRVDWNTAINELVDRIRVCWNSYAKVT